LSFRSAISMKLSECRLKNSTTLSSILIHLPGSKFCRVEPIFNSYLKMYLNLSIF
jgi:hypothetical protein